MEADRGQYVRHLGLSTMSSLVNGLFLRGKSRRKRRYAPSRRDGY